MWVSFPLGIQLMCANWFCFCFCIHTFECVCVHTQSFVRKRAAIIFRFFFHFDGLFTDDHSWFVLTFSWIVNTHELNVCSWNKSHRCPTNAMINSNANQFSPFDFSFGLNHQILFACFRAAFNYKIQIIRNGPVCIHCVMIWNDRFSAPPTQFNDAFICYYDLICDHLLTKKKVYTLIPLLHFLWLISKPRVQWIYENSIRVPHYRDNYLKPNAKLGESNCIYTYR